MTKTLTLDKVLTQFKSRILEGTAASNIHGYDDAKQAILQWVADDLIGYDEQETGYGKRDGEYEMHVHRNNLRDEQRQILKAHGWKPSDKEEV